MLHDFAMEELVELGRRIRLERLRQGLTQEEFAARADIDRSYVGGVERGERNVTFSMLCRICAALHRDVAYLTNGLPGGNE